MEEIKNYLEQETKSFEAGLELLKQHVNSQHLIHHLSVRKNQASLEIELQKVLIKEEGFVPIVVTVKTNKGTETTTTDIKLSDEERQEKVDQLAIELNSLHVQRCKLSNQLADLEEGPELEELVKEILEVKEKYRVAFRKSQNLQNGMEEPEYTEAEKKYISKELPSVAILRIKAELQPLREKASKLAAKIAKQPDHQKIKEWQTELVQVESMKEDLEIRKKLLEESND